MDDHVYSALAGARFCDGGESVNCEHSLPITLIEPKPRRWAWYAIGGAAGLAVGIVTYFFG